MHPSFNLQVHVNIFQIIIHEQFGIHLAYLLIKDGCLVNIMWLYTISTYNKTMIIENSLFKENVAIGKNNLVLIVQGRTKVQMDLRKNDKRMIPPKD